MYARFDQIEATHAAQGQGVFNRTLAEAMALYTEWLGREIHSTTGGKPEDDTGTVEFVTRLNHASGYRVHHELGRFRCDGNC